MQSPFPGMNPYLEQPLTWRGFHNHLLTSLQVELTELVDPTFFVRQEESAVVFESYPSDAVFPIRPDLAVTRGDDVEARRGDSAHGESVSAGPVVGEVLLAEEDVEQAPWLEIRTVAGHELVTVIELLSPTNKRMGQGRSEFLEKRRRYLGSSAHYVEIDLLRTRPRLPIQGLPECDYYVMSSRADRRPSVDLWPIRLRDRLPTVSIPLQSPLPKVDVDLQRVFSLTYVAGRYGRYVHNTPPDPPLSPSEQVWANELLKSSS
jgi:hypothetical protein